MAPIKFEENIREKLQERELQPSKDAWGKLSNELGEEPQEKKSAFFWMAIAASFVGVLLVVTFLSRTEDGVSEQMAEEPLDKIQVEIEESNILEAPLKTQEIQTTSNEIEKERNKAGGLEKNNDKDITSKKVQETAVANNDKSVQEISKKKDILNKKLPVSEEIIKESVVASTTYNKRENEVVVPLKQQDFIQQKVEEVVAQLQNENSSITDAAIDALLAKAQRDIATNRILNATKVDATALLQDVELELEQNFRNKVFEALGEGFDKVRTAVVERNN